jgi:hypothetical protein
MKPLLGSTLAAAFLFVGDAKDLQTLLAKLILRSKTVCFHLQP